MIPKFPTVWLQLEILHVADLRPFDYKLLADLFALTGPTSILFWPEETFHQYLFLRHFFPNDLIQRKYDVKDFKPRPEDYENPTKYNELATIIKNDDVESYIKFITNNKNYNKDFDINGFEFISTQTFMTFCGSINLLKYELKHSDISGPMIEEAIKSGSKEVIQLFLSKGIKFENDIFEMLKYQENDLAKYVYDKYDVKFDPLDCVIARNEELLLWLLNDKKVHPDQGDHYGDHALMFVVEHGDALLTEYLIAKGADPFQTGEHGRTVFCHSSFIHNDEEREAVEKVLKPYEDEYTKDLLKGGLFFMFSR